MGGVQVRDVLALLCESAGRRTVLTIDAVLHPWWEVGDWLAAQMFRGFDASAPDARFDAIMRAREDRARDEKKG
jgi:hypothetical protein